MPQCKGFIKRFLRDASPLLECQKILKAKGLSHDTHDECRRLLNTIPHNSSTRIGFIKWMQEQLSVAEKLELTYVGMPISSDGIESLFGTAKQHGTGKIKDANRIALRIPTLCGPLTRKDAQRVLEIKVVEQQAILKELPSLIKQRRQVLPNPGCDLESTLVDQGKRELELIPQSKKREKNKINGDILNDYGNYDGPNTGGGMPIISSP